LASASAVGAAGANVGRLDDAGEGLTAYGVGDHGQVNVSQIAINNSTITGKTEARCSSGGTVKLIVQLVSRRQGNRSDVTRKTNVGRQVDYGDIVAHKIRVPAAVHDHASGVQSGAAAVKTN
ncbi:hypothetical protein P5E51_15855, partial [Clostridium perfringens]|nr:hypothetical protein [Clostridium perfringens]